MPLYVARCPEHGEFETFLSLAEREKTGLLCIECAQESRVVIQPVRTIGPMPSKPLVIDQIGRSFTSQSEMRQYFKKHPDRRIVENNSQDFINHRDSARAKADKKAKQLGFNDVEDRKTRVKADRKIKTRIAREGAKVQR